MARFARRGDNEPLMRLERPSSASVQTTAHIINSCFNEMLSQRQPLDGEAINSLAVSRRGDSDYHDGFLSELKKVRDEYASRLEEFTAVERHVVQARARALAEDEKAIAPGHQDIGIPRGPSQLRKHLNEELLSRHHLLSPTEYLPQPPTTTGPPLEDAPYYLKSTFTSSQHATIPTDLHQIATIEKHTRKQAIPRVVKTTLSPLERETSKADFLRNPKYSSSVLTNTASSGPIKRRQAAKRHLPELAHEAPQFFVAEPSEVVFTDYRAGQTYKETVELKNVTSASRNLRIVPVNSPYFTVTPEFLPNADGLVAPGMQCTYTVTFTPDSLANYEEELRVLTHCGECLTVLLKGCRPSPELTLPSLLDCGYCLAGADKTVSLECCNTGGEGNFRLLHTTGDEAQPTATLHVGSFSISPTEFYLPGGGKMEFTVTFAPPEVGSYSGHFQMACDNGQVQSFEFSGIAEQASIGCVFIGQSSTTEIASFTSDHTYLGGDDPAVICDNYYYEEVIDPSIAEFGNVNPHNSAYRTIVIRNFGNVDLSYHWRFYRPLTEHPQTSNLPAAGRHENKPTISALIESDHTPFSVWPDSGTLQAGQANPFVFRFQPEQVGSECDMAYLVLSGIPSASLDTSTEGSQWLNLNDCHVSMACIQLMGTAEAYNVELHPPAILLPGKLPAGTETRKRLKMMNHSLSTVSYSWRQTDCEVEVKVEPSSGSMVSGGTAYCEVVIGGDKGRRREEGAFSAQLLCGVEHSDVLLVLPVEGYVQGPSVSLDRASLKFGLLPLGHSASLQLTVVNDCNCSLEFELAQIVRKEEETEFMDHACLTFNPSSGVLRPHGTRVITVECKPEITGRLRSMVECRVDGKAIRHADVLAEVQRPEVCLDSCTVHVERAFAGIEVQRMITLKNVGLIPTQFAWSSQLQGNSCEQCSVQINPVTGRIGPRERVEVCVKATWNKVGTYPEVVAKCCVVGMEESLLLCLSANVRGLSVVYSVEKMAAETRVDDTTVDGLVLDFGSGNSLGSPRTLAVRVTNTSAIPTSLSASVKHFPAARFPTPLTKPVGEASTSRGRYLLSRTVNTGNTRSKQSNTACASTLLRDGGGCCFVVEPCSFDLPAFESRVISVTAHSDMWGEYEDLFVCEVEGLDPHIIPIHIGVTGCPVLFQATATPAYALTRFGTHPPNATIRRVMKITNTSPLAIRIDWTAFNIPQEDNQLLDLLTYIGEPFPKVSSVPTSNCCSTDSLDTAVSGDERDGVSGDERGSGPVTDTLIKVLLNPHEGISSEEPFNIHPKQMTLPAHGQAIVHVTFQPSVRTLRELGDSLTSYALGYLSLDQQCPPHVQRLCGYQVQPLRIDMTAGIKHAKLIVESDEDKGLNFNYPASILLLGDKIEGQASKSHHITLLNQSSSTLEFKLGCSSLGRFSIAVPTADYIALKPGRSTSLTVSFSLHHKDVTSADSSRDCLCFSDQLCVDFRNGQTQVFQLTAAITLPSMMPSLTEIDFGTCLLNKTHTSTMTLSNPTSSSALWRAYIPPEHGNVISLCPESGHLLPHMSNGGTSYELIHISVTPRHECTYNSTIVFEEMLTSKRYVFQVPSSRLKLPVSKGRVLSIQRCMGSSRN